VKTGVHIFAPYQILIKKLFFDQTVNQMDSLVNITIVISKCA